MTDGELLLRGVLEEPADDTARLVYADWLDENGEPERAEFVRVQVELSNRGYPGPLSHRAAAIAIADVAKLEPLVGRSVAILYSHVADWLGDPFILIDPQYVRDWSWSRGFLVHIEIPFSDFMEHAEAIFAAHPITSVRLVDKYADEDNSDSDEFIGRLGQSFDWRMSDHYRETSEPNVLPREFLDIMANMYPRRASVRGQDPRYFESRTQEDAREVLSQVAVQIGRKRAGLKPLELIPVPK